MRRIRLVVGGLVAVAVMTAALLVLRGPTLPRRAPEVAPSVSQADVLGRWALLDGTIRIVGAPHVTAGVGGAEPRPEDGAVLVTADLLRRGRDAFYLETFGNEVFFSDVLGVLDGAIGPWAMARAIVALRGRPTSNLRVRLDRAVRVGGRTFPAGTVLDTGLDVPPRALVPLGMRIRLARGRIEVGVTCALCHATVDPATGRILEGAPNADLKSGLLLALAANSAAMFRQTGVDPRRIPTGSQKYRDASGALVALPDAGPLEDAVDADLLAWPPGSFDSTGDLVNDPSQIPSSFTRDAWPYGWSGFAAIGWFHGLTTLNNNVHAVNSDPTTGADGSETLLGIDRERYLGIIFARAARRAFRLPEGALPSEFFARIDPTPGVPGMNRVVAMPGYPKGSPFMLDGLMAATPGRPVGEALNGMSAWQDTLAPPPHADDDRDAVRRGASVFERAGCGTCHAGRTLTDHRIVPVAEIGTEPARAAALAAFPRSFVDPATYPPSVTVPVPPGAPVVAVPAAASPGWPNLAYAGDGRGGYKVPSLVGLAVTAPYLHDGGVAAAAGAVAADGSIADATAFGLPGTLLRAVPADPATSLRVLVERRLRELAVTANRASAELVRAHVDGRGHAFWVDGDAGFTDDDQRALVAFLLSLDDEPMVVPDEGRTLTATR